MQINTNGKRNITLDFDAPKKFKLKKDGAEIPYIRTGKNSFRLGRNIDGVLDLEEVIEQPRIVKPMQLQAQQMAFVNPNDVLMINQAAQQLEVEQNILGETQKRVEQTQAYLDIQQQRINESVLSVQGLENDNAERITATENGIFNLAGNLATVEQNLVDGIGAVKNELDEHKTAENPHGITKETIGLNKVDNTSDLDKPISKAVQSALDEKADKDEIQAIRDELGEYQEKNDRFTNALSNYTGGLAGNQLPDGGSEGQILAKRSDMSGDAEWVDSSASITVDDELSLTSENPVQNKVITLAINNISDGITDISNKVESIESKIPAQASSSNQLADKDFVNSSIATNTATFRGTFNSVAELEAYSGEKDNNDYVFVTGIDQAGNTYYDRYKYNGSSWVYEYRLNNSSFTSTQWESINSGATTQSINQISTNTANINLLQTSKQDTISDLETIRSGAALGATAVQPSDLNGYATENYVTTAVSGKQDTLVSGTNIKTINNTSILGSGNISVGVSNPLKVEKTVGTDNYFYEVGINNDNRIYTQCGVNKGGLTTLIPLPTSYSFSGTDIDISYGSYSDNQEYIKTVSLSVSSNIARVSDIPAVDQTYSASSTNAQSGVAVASAISTKQDTISDLATIRSGAEAGATALQPADLNNTLAALYPVGAIYIGTQATCPLATLISGSTWELISAGRVLQGADSGHAAGTTIEAGLPNITGNVVFHHGNIYGTIAGAYGAFTPDTQVPNYSLGTGQASTAYGSFNFSAGDSNSIYGNSTTVQPPAYVVNIWRRTA